MTTNDKSGKVGQVPAAPLARRNRRKELSFRTKLLLPIVIGSSILLAALGVSIVMRTTHAAEAAYRDRARGILDFMVNLSSSYLQNFDVTALETFVKQATVDPIIQSAAFTDVEGNVIAKSARSTAPAPQALRMGNDIKDASGMNVGSAQIVVDYHALLAADQRDIVAIFAATMLVTELLIACLAFFVITRVSRSIVAVIDDVTAEAGMVFAISTHVEAASQGLSGAAAQQTSAIGKTTRSLEDMSVMISMTSQEASWSLGVARSGLEEGKAAGAVIERLNDSMAALHAANSKLADIVGTINEIESKTNIINEIVFKTQLLAVNASIEAARAGAQGRGFAVVASEIGSLALISGKAAGEINELLANSSSQVRDSVATTTARVEDGGKIADECLRAFQMLRGALQNIAKAAESITDAATEQERGVEQTSGAIAAMGCTTEANVAHAQRMAANSGDLRQRAAGLARATERLNDIMGRDDSAPDQRQFASPSTPPSREPANGKTTGSVGGKPVTRGRSTVSAA